MTINHEATPNSMIRTLAVLLAMMLAPMVFAQEPSKTEQPKQVDEFQLTMNNARLMLAQGRIDDAVNEFRNAAKLKGDKCSECYQSIGQVYFQLGKFKEAATAYKEAADLKPANEAELCNVLGVALY